MATGFKQATVNASDVPATLTNYPAYVDLSRLGITTLAEAQSVRCYSDSAKTIELAREIVTLSEMHVKIPSLTSTFILYVDWDGVRADYAVTATYGRNAVWSDYFAVYHMNETGGSHTDSTGNGRTLTTELGDPTENVTGKIGKAADFDGNDAYINTSFEMGNPTKLTVTAWASIDSTGNPGSYGHLSAGRYTGASVQWPWLLDMRAGKLYSYVFRQTNGSYAIEVTGATTLSTGTLYHIGLTYDGAATKSELWLNGVSDGSATNALVTNLYSGSFDEIHVGRYENSFGDRYIDGKLDEIRVTTTQVRSANWFTTEYNNQSDEAGFWGTWTDAGGGGVNTTRFFPAFAHI